MRSRYGIGCAAKKGVTLAPFITQLNEIRRKNVALQRLRNLHFHPTDSDQVIAYSKRDGDNLVLVVVNLDGFHAQETTIHWDLWALGVSKESFDVLDLLDNKSYNWGKDTYVKLDPARPIGKVAHICRVKL